MAKILEFDPLKHPFEDVLVRGPYVKTKPKARMPWEPLVVVDLFAGAGGFSSGIIRALAGSGRKIIHTTVNHWAPSCATMKANHPEANVYNASVEVVRPQFAVPGGRIDLLVASPECITFSPARGKKNPIREQSRSSAAFIYEWLSCPSVQIDAFILENVTEWQNWGPLDERKQPIKEREGEYFESFLREIRKLGYRVEYRMLNAADYGDVTSRKRLFVMGRCDGAAIQWPDQTHAENPMEGRGVKRWRAAWEVIDWTVPGQSIFNREKGPHAPKTLVRMRAGFAKQTGILAGAYVEALDRFIPIAEDFQAECKAIEAKWKGKGRAAARTRAHEKSAAKERARERTIEAFVLPVGAFRNVGKEDGTSMILGQHGGATARDARTAPIPTIATGGAIAKFEGTLTGLVGLAKPSKRRRPKNDLELAFPEGETPAEGFTFPVNHGRDEDRTKTYDETLGTFTTKRSDAKADPTLEPIAFVSEQRGFYEKNVAYSARGTDVVLSGITAHANHHALVQGESESLPSIEPEAFISHLRGYFGEDRLSRTASSTEAPLDTISAGGRHHAIVKAKIVQATDGKVRPWVVIDGVPHAIDVLFRMLMNRELAHAMSFIDDNYEYVFLGGTAAVTRQIGNAVPVRLSTALVSAQMRKYVGPRNGRRKKRITEDARGIAA